MWYILFLLFFFSFNHNIIIKLRYGLNNFDIFSGVGVGSKIFLNLKEISLILGNFGFIIVWESSWFDY